MLRLAALPAIIAIAILVAWKTGYFELDRRQELVERVQRLRVVPGIEIMFIAAAVLAICFCLSSTVMTVVGGALFGFMFGSAFTLAAMLLGSVVAYALSWRIARGALMRLFGEHRLLRELRRRDGVLAFFRLRVLPVAPFGVLPYAAGLADASLRRLLVATVLGALPSALAYSWLGQQLMEAAAADGRAAQRAVWMALAVTAGMLALSLVPAGWRRWKQSRRWRARHTKRHSVDRH